MCGSPYRFICNWMQRSECNIQSYYLKSLCITPRVPRYAILFIWRDFAECGNRKALRLKAKGVYSCKWPSLNVENNAVSAALCNLIIWRDFAECGNRKALRLKAKGVYSCKWPSLNVENNAASAALCKVALSASYLDKNAKHILPT